MFHVSIWGGAWSFVWGVKFPKDPRGDRTDDIPCGFHCCCSTTERISTLQQIFEKSWQHVEDVWPTHVLSTSGNYMEGFLA